MGKDIFTDCVNGEIRPGDLVISTLDDDYGCLVGTVLEISKLGTPEHDAETDNPTDDVHVNFYNADYSDRRVKEIEAMFSDLYGEPKEFDDCPIDDTIMSPDCLIRITDIEHDTLAELLDSKEAAAAFCRSALRVRELTDRLTQNLSDYRDSLLTLDKEEIIGDAGMIAAVTDTHYYLTENHVFEDSEVDYLLLFENPLEVVAEKWCDRTAQMDDFPFALHEVFDKQDALQGGYQLYVEPKPPVPPKDIPTDIRQAARYEAERLLYELKTLKTPNHPDNVQYMARISPEFIKQAGSSYDKLLFEALHPPLPITFGPGGKRDGVYLSMTGGVRSSIEVIKPASDITARVVEHKAEYGVTEKKSSILEQLQAARQAATPDRPHKPTGVSKDEPR